MPKRHLNGLTPVLLIANTDSSGVATFTIPAGRITRYEGCVATPKSATSTGRFSCQVISEPMIGTNLTAVAGTVTVAVSVSNQQLLSVLGTTIVGMVAAGSGIPVMLLAWGE